MTSGTSSSEECPPETSRARTGSGSGPCSRVSTATCAARWFTPYSGTPSPSASALAAATPTVSAPTSPGPGGDRDRVHLAQAHPGLAAGPLDGRHHRLEMGPAGHLGHDAAEPRVLVDRAGDCVDEQPTVADQTDPGLVARGLDAEYERHDRIRLMISASAPGP